MDKVYLVMFNDTETSWYDSPWVEVLSKSYRGASEYLMSKGFIPSYDKWDAELLFTLNGSDGNTRLIAWIEEKELVD